MFHKGTIFEVTDEYIIIDVVVDGIPKRIKVHRDEMTQDQSGSHWVPDDAEVEFLPVMMN